MPTRVREAGEGAASRPAGTDALDGYMQSLRGIPLLAHEEILALARTARREEAAFRDALLRIPAAADLLVRRWRARRDAGRTTAVLAAGAAEGGGAPKLDRALAAVERLRADAPGRGAPLPATGIDTQVGQLLREAGLDTDVLVAAHRALADREGEGEGLVGAAFREAHRRAGRALERRDAALRTLVRHNLRLVVAVARRHRERGVAFLDLVQDGNLGLIRAAQKFDPERGFRFSTYAVWWIEQAMIRSVQKGSRTIRVPSHVYERQVRVRHAAAALRGRAAEEPDAETLAREAGLPVAEVQAAQDALGPQASLDDPLPGSEDLTWADVATDPGADDPVRGIARGEARRALGRGLSRLAARERRVVRARFGLDGDAPRTLESIGRELGLSRERVRQIEAGALEKLRGSRRLAALAERSAGEDPA